MNKRKFHLLFYLQPDVYCYLLLAVVVAIILFVIICVTIERAEF